MTAESTPATIDIRRARLDDAVEMARLSGELGYPLSADEMGIRLAVLLPEERHLVVVAAEGESLHGWAHVEHRFTLEGGDRAELMGLVVDARARGQGMGRQLVEVVEAWTIARGLSVVTVRSNAARAEAHPFYETLGYARRKTQHVYSKTLIGRRNDDAPAG
jgi:GNAT superfamily N-acetyltransferase